MGLQAAEGGRVDHLLDAVGQAIDLVAWRPDQPQRWGLRRDIGFCLGEVWLSAAAWDSSGIERLPLFATPLDWLLADCQGCCVLRPSQAWAHMNPLDAVTVADVSHGNAVEKMLTPRMPRPQIFVRQKTHA